MLNFVTHYQKGMSHLHKLKINVPSPNINFACLELFQWIAPRPQFGGLPKKLKCKLTTVLSQMAKDQKCPVPILTLNPRTIIQLTGTFYSTYPGLPLVAELIPEAKTCLVNMVRKCPMSIKRLL